MSIEESQAEPGLIASQSLTTPPAADPAADLYPDDLPPEQDDAANPEGADDQAKPEAASHDYDLTMPDGVALDTALLSTAAPLLRDAGVSRDQAQKLVPIVMQVQERYIRQQYDEFELAKAEWARATSNDPNIGRGNFKETRRLVDVALNAAGAGPKSEFSQLLAESGLNNHPAVLRVLRFFGQQIEAKGTKARPRGQSAAERLYPDDFKK
jgi:hypothetical protein